MDPPKPPIASAFDAETALRSPAGDLVTSTEHSELLNRLGASGLARISQGLTSSRSSNTIAAPGRKHPAHSFQDATSLFDAPACKPELQDNLCSICQENVDPHANCRELLCGHRFHVHCIATYSHSQAAAKRLPCPVCRQPFNAYHDHDKDGYAQAREVLSDVLTATHLGMRHSRPAQTFINETQPATSYLSSYELAQAKMAAALDAANEDDIKSIKRARDQIPRDDGNDDEASIDSILASIKQDLKELALEEEDKDQQAMEVLRSASLGELLATLPNSQPPQSAAMMEMSLERQSRKRRRKLSANYRHKRKTESERMLHLETTLTEMKSQNQQLHQRWQTLNAKNQWLNDCLALVAPDDL
eukprot:TRINITY_DN305_c0_g1_i1.p1 TRINITY_DN305_c0_g1~~TRINITY_DN305_c0_g1_i1.p1  ORF type:complete len:361 (-),score=64.29 TRINITY_DN305_c0_g1_i1:365-1447(-)